MRERYYQDTQNPTRKKTYVALDMSLYNASLLRDEVAFEIAMGDLESCLARAPSAECIVEQLVSVPHLLEFIISGEYSVSSHQDVLFLKCFVKAVDDNVARILSECIIGVIPDEAIGFATSLGARILDNFSLFLEFLPYPSPSEKPPNILERRHYVEHARRALQLLAEHPLAMKGTAGNRSGSKGARQKGKKAVKNTVSMKVIDPDPFNALGVVVPVDEDEVYSVVKSIVDEQKQCMEVSSVLHAVVTAYNTTDVVLSSCSASCTPARDHTTRFRFGGRSRFHHPLALR